MKKVFKILTLIMLILTIFKITDTYAKYFTKATAVKEQAVGQWEILLNDTDIYSETGQIVTFEMGIDYLSADPNTMPGKIAPDTTWYSDITLNPAGTDVAIKYDITVDPTQIQNGDLDIQYEVSVVDGVKELKRTGINTYTGIIDLAQVQAGTPDEIRCSLIWNENTNKAEEDTAISATHGQKLNLPIQIICTQYLGEQIFEYTP